MEVARKIEMNKRRTRTERNRRKEEIIGGKDGTRKDGGGEREIKVREGWKMNGRYARRMRMERNGWKKGKNWNGLFPFSLIFNSTSLFIDSYLPSFQTLTSLSK